MEFNWNRTQKSSETYPMLKVSEADGLIVLFTAPKRGVVLGGGDNITNKHGEYRSDWIEYHFEPYHGTVTLEN